MATLPVEVIAGIDTHADTHHAAVINTTGQHLGDAEFPTTAAGYAALTAFLTAFGTITRVGVEGTGSYGAGISRHLHTAGLEVVEVIRPNRQLRRLRGKSDPIDAYAAARTALAESEPAIPKIADGPAEAVRYLLVARRSALKARTAAQAQITSLLVTAPEPLRQRFRDQTAQAVIAGLARLRPAHADPIPAALRSIARRHQHLTEELNTLEDALAPLVAETNPALAAAKGIGTITAAQLLVTAGDNPDRLRSEAAFAALCGTSPIPASSGKTHRHRLNRGGDRHANSALHRIAVVRMRHDPRTRDYVEKKRAESRSNTEILRCLKRAIAREVFTLLTKPVDIPRIDDLRPFRLALGITLETAAGYFSVWPTKLSRIERGLARDDDLAQRYRDWLETTAPTS